MDVTTQTGDLENRVPEQDLPEQDLPLISAEQLREYEMYRRAVETVREVIFQTDARGRWTFLNAAWERTTGDAVGATLGCEVLEWFHPSFHEQALVMVAALIEGSLLECESEALLRCRAENGEIEWRAVEIVKRPLWDENGEFVGVAGTMHDISVRKTAEIEGARVEAALRESEAELRASEAELRTLFSEMQELVLTLNPQGVYLRVAPTNPQLLYRQADALLGRSAYDVFDAEKAQMFVDVVARVAQSGQRETIEYELIIGEHELWFEAAISRLLDGNVLFVARDVTERRQTQHALRQSEERFRAFMDASTFIAFMKDPEGRFVYCNQAVRQRFNEDSEDWIGKTVFDILPAAVAQTLHEHDQNVLRGEQTITYYEDVPTIDSEDVTWLSSKFPLHDGDGRKYLGAIAFDVSEQKRAERALEQTTRELKRSNRELERFAYVASHDLQEPLRMVISYLQLLEKRYSSQLDADAQEFIGFAVDGSLRMRALIGDLLEYSRDTRRELEFSIVDGNQALDNALLNLAVTIRESGALIDRDDLPKVRGDLSQLTRLWQNLLANALKFRGNEVPHLQIRCRDAGETGAMWEWSVCDNGIGIAPEYHERIFAVFQRLHERDKFDGTGIGLAIVQKIVERHGGEIRIESQEGQGATFLWTIPKISAQNV